MIQIIQKESEQIWCLYYQNATRYLTIRLKTSVKTIRLSWRFLFLERGDLLAKTKIKVIRCYDGNRTAKDILNEAIALKVRKKLNDDIENIRRKEDNSDSTQYKKHP